MLDLRPIEDSSFGVEVHHLTDEHGLLLWHERLPPRHEVEVVGVGG